MNAPVYLRLLRTSPIRAWTPFDCRGLDMWFSADTLSNGLVTSWKDRIGGLVAVLGNGVARPPTRAANSFNGAYAGVTFDGSPMWLDVRGIGSLPSGTAESTLMAVIDQQALASDGIAIRNIFGYGGQFIGTGHSTRTLRANVISAVRRFCLHDATTDFLDTATNFYGLFITAGRFSGATGYGWLNGTATTPSTGAIPFNTVKTDRIRISGTVGTPNPATGSSSLWQFFNGVIRHLFAGNFSDADRQRLEGWSAWNSGMAAYLPVGHPYKNAAPTR